MARPRKYNVDDIIEKMDKYIRQNDEPLIQEFILDYGISKAHLYELEKESEGLSDAIKKCIQKQEVYLLRNASVKAIDPVFTMFRLKQPCFGYKDKQEVESKNINLNKDMSDMGLEEIDAEIEALQNSQGKK
jgi:hypothetical protein